jgi:hypothetical protein
LTTRAHDTRLAASSTDSKDLIGLDPSLAIIPHGYGLAL